MTARIRLLTAVATLASAALVTVPATAGADGFPLLGWWPMNEGSGQVVHDWSGKGNHGQLGDTAGADDHDPSWIPGVFAGSALRFDGDDFVQIPDSTSLSPQSQITVATWFRGATSPGIASYLVSKGSVRCDRASYGLYTAGNGGLAFYISDATTFYRSPVAPATVWDGRWHHAAGTFDGSTVRLFVDGQQVGSGTPTPPGTQIAYSGGGAPSGGGFIGDFHGDPCDLYLVGDIDGVQVWSRALPVADIWRILKALFTTSR